jgi:hypothetical protein
MAQQRVVCGKVRFEPVERLSRLRRAPSDCWSFDSDGEFSSRSETLRRRRRVPIAAPAHGHALAVSCGRTRCAGPIEMRSLLAGKRAWRPYPDRGAGAPHSETLCLEIGGTGWTTMAPRSSVDNDEFAEYRYPDDETPIARVYAGCSGLWITIPIDVVT